jgi:ribosomal protein L21E
MGTHLDVGDRVRIDIPDVTDPDYEEYHGRHGVIVRVQTDDAGSVTEDARDDHLYRGELDDGNRVDFRWRDLRPPLDE